MSETITVECVNVCPNGNGPHLVKSMVVDGTVVWECMECSE